MTQKQLLILGAVAVAAFALWQRHTKGQVTAASFVGVKIGEAGNLIPSDSAMYNWMMGQE